MSGAAAINSRHGAFEPGAGVRAARAFIRSLSPRLREDRPLARDIEAVATSIRDGSLLAAVEADTGELA